MTLREFAEKYDVPYNVAYNATYKVKSYSSMMHDKEYPEDELLKESIRRTEEIIEYHRSNLEKNTQILAKLKRIF